MRRTLFIAAPVAAIALAVAGCGGSSSGGGSKSYTTAAPSMSSTKAAATVSLKKTSLGTMLVGPNGRSLYLFLKDKTGKSTCSGACASAWPPLTTNGKPTAGKGVKASLLTTVKRSDGSTEVVYNHHPLYFYAGDSAPGQTTGEGLNQFGAPWYVLNPTGNKIDKT